MAWYRIAGGGTVHINFGRGRKARERAPLPCRAPFTWPDGGMVCQCMSLYLCDWKTGLEETCSMPMCSDHAFDAGPDRHLCPGHREEYRVWLRDQAIAY